MKSISINTKVVNGNFKQNRPLILNAIKSFESKEITIVLRLKRKQRSTPQNAYYWGVLIPLLQEAIKKEWGEVWNQEKAHELLKSKFLYFEKVNENTGEVIKTPKSTTENSTTEQEEYHLEIREFLKDWFNVDAPLPNEDLILNI